MKSTRVVALLACAAFCATAIAQETVSAPRTDGKTTPLMIYRAAGETAACAPLAVISHGAGGSEKGYRYLAEAMAKAGYLTVVMGHRESGLDALKADMRADGIHGGVRDLVADRGAEEARLLDVGAALQWADKQCRAPFRVLLGHSMGSSTVMLEAGAGNMIGVTSPPAGRDRFDTYVALSPEGPGVVFTEHAWERIHKPMLILTGTRDQAVNGGPETRQIPWQHLPGGAQHCQWMGVIDGATHMNFAGVGFGATRIESTVTETINEFLKGVRGHSCTLPAAKGITLEAK